MPTHDITLPGSQRPEWPDRCVCCETPQPGHTARIAVTGSSSTFGWTTDTALLAAGQPVQGTNRRVQITVPCCARCAPPLQRRHFWKTVALYASGLLGAAVCLVVIVWAIAHGLSVGWGAFLGLLALLAFVAMPVAYEFKWPPAFTITPLEDRVTYEFVSAVCAEEFARANDPSAGAPP
jgi:hypothetical protein